MRIGPKQGHSFERICSCFSLLAPLVSARGVPTKCCWNCGCAFDVMLQLLHQFFLNHAMLCGAELNPWMGGWLDEWTVWACKCLRMYLYVSLCICMCQYVSVCVSMSIHLPIYLYLSISLPAYLPTYLATYPCMCVCTCACVCVIV
jgi:hypothetical protein